MIAMNRGQIDLVQDTFGIILNQSEKVAEDFYDILFTLKPEYRSMFKGDLRQNGEKLMATLKLAVMGLENLEMIEPLLKDLGRGHAEKYGVKPEDYDVVGHALLMALEKRLGNLFSAELKNAWMETYDIVANKMIQGGLGL